MSSENCPACSAPLVMSVLTFSDSTVSPLQIRCSNTSCGGDCHRHPERISQHREHIAGAVERARVALEKAKPKVEGSPAAASSEDEKPPKVFPKRR